MGGQLERNIKSGRSHKNDARRPGLSLARPDPWTPIRFELLTKETTSQERRNQRADPRGGEPLKTHARAQRPSSGNRPEEAANAGRIFDRPKVAVPKERGGQEGEKYRERNDAPPST